MRNRTRLGDTVMAQLQHPSTCLLLVDACVLQVQAAWRDREELGSSTSGSSSSACRCLCGRRTERQRMGAAMR